MDKKYCEQQYGYELNFKYLGNSKVIYENYTPAYEEDVKLSDLDSQFLYYFKIKDDSNYFLQKVESDDSYLGFELKFNVKSAGQLMQINQISENSLYEGITIKSQSVPCYEQMKNQEQKQENQLDSFEYTRSFLQKWIPNPQLFIIGQIKITLQLNVMKMDQQLDAVINMGFYVDSEIYHGYSHYCKTFGNDVLIVKRILQSIEWTYGEQFKVEQ